MKGIEKRGLSWRRVAVKILIAFAFGLVFSGLIEVGIPLILEASGSKKLVLPTPPPKPPTFPHFDPPKAPLFKPR